MPEETIPTKETPTEEVQEVKEEIPKPVEEIEEKKEKRWLKPFLFSILGIVLAAGLVFAGYKLSQKKVSPQPTEGPTPAISPEVTPSAGAYRIAGIDLAVNKALRVERKTDKDLLVLTVTFAANVECPLSGGAVCGYDIRGFGLVDEEGFIQDMLFSFPKVKYLTTNPISQRILKLGEKDKGDIFFDIPKDKNKFFLTYSSTGETTEKILIEPELFDPTANWITYKNEEAGISFKYLNDWTAEPFNVSGYAAYHGIANLKIKGREYGPEPGTVWITYWDNPENLDLKEFEQKYTGASGKGPGLYYIETEKGTISGVASYYTEKADCEPVLCSKHIVSYKNKIYDIAISGSASIEEGQIVNLILLTFKFLE